MKYGYVSIVLHTHLPFIRNPYKNDTLEERWLFEAMHESYIPILQMFYRLYNDKIPFKITMSFSPTILTMLSDEYLNSRFENYLINLIILSEKEIERNSHNNELCTLSLFYHERFKQQLEFYYANDKNLINCFKFFYDMGFLELITSAATHAFLPLMTINKESLKAQIHTGIKTFEHFFGHTPPGFWLPECGYNYNLDYFLSSAGIKYFISENQGVLNASPKPIYGTFAPIATPNGIGVFPRDSDASREVWSSAEGYPGDSCYREFYRDIGHDLPMDYIKHYISQKGIRVDTGIKYHRITGRTEDKLLYERLPALTRAFEHGRHFAEARRNQVESLLQSMDIPPIIVCPYDTELFGHWWFEGPEFLEAFIRNASEYTQYYKLTTPYSYLQHYNTLQCSTPSPSSWGNNGDYSTWLNKSTHWIYIELYKCEVSLIDIIKDDNSYTPLQQRLLKQAIRELMLAQSSDWAFMISRNTTVAFAVEQINSHIYNFWRLFNGINQNIIEEKWLNYIENMNNIFPSLDYNLYKKDV